MSLQEVLRIFGNEKQLHFSIVQKVHFFILFVLFFLKFFI